MTHWWKIVLRTGASLYYNMCTYNTISSHMILSFRNTKKGFRRKCAYWRLRVFLRAISGTKARIFLLVDIRKFFSDLGWGDEKKIKKLWKWPVNWSFSELFFFFFFFFFFFWYFQLFFHISRNSNTSNR